MTEGLLWFDDSKVPMSDKAQKALDYYMKKFGVPAQVLETSLRDEVLPDGLQLIARVQRVSIPKHHFLIGIE
jgi:hypothetical protein